MILDKEWQLADGTWAPTATGDNVSPNVVDLAPFGGLPNANTGRDIGQGEELYLIITVKQTVTSGGAATVDFRIRTDSASSLTSAPVDVVSTGAIAKATLIAGYQIRMRFPPATYKRYIGVNANIGTAVLTAGMFEIDVTKNPQMNTKYAGAYSIDV